ncbi:chitobiase/beta-hexosaminidase C-terminal domain-containing protein [uncultured Sphaerochaeta sp.]|uniref:beta strand repeat-containing protein n=1 Tax=uncultured Sphaerochaeta sp. TaxID=886478 RepID=UPI002A0A38F5|nr:chitobiase/beta-hexosaminidase C-terminal domain-containing protein [uncultured Sphaerochaeta sp.]
MKEFVLKKKHSICIYLIVACAFVLTSCAQAGMPDPFVGSLSVSANLATAGSRASGTASTAEDIVLYRLSGSGPDGYSLDIENVSLPWVISRLPIGKWTMTLDAYGDGDIQLLTGNKSLEVSSGTLKKIAFSLISPELANQVVAPVFSPSSEEFFPTETFTISSPTAGAVIYYSTDGSIPNETSLLYEGAITLNDSTTVKAIAIKDEMTNSSVATAVYTKTSQVATPIITPAGGTITGSQQVTLSCSTANAVIHYTIDGSEPTVASSVYTGAFTVMGTTTVKALAVKTNLINSSVATVTYTYVSLPTVETPVINPGGGSFSGSKTVTLSCATSGAVIHYTLDNSTPSASSDTYYDPLVITTGTTIKAIATKSGYQDSAVAEETYSLRLAVSTPILSPAGGAFVSSTSVVASCSTDGAVIYYTTDGSTPTTSSSLYGSPIFLDASTTIKAMAMKTGMSNSSVASGVYTIKVATPTISEPSSIFSGSLTVALGCSTTGASIWYTTDGTTPTTSSILYTNPITVTDSMTLTAVGARSGCENSSTIQATYTKQGTVITPTISASAITGGQEVILGCGTTGATIYYTLDGSVPTIYSTPYTSPFTVTGDTTVKAFAIKTGMDDSAVATSSISLTTVVTPSIIASDVAGGQRVTITSSTSGATIHYTTDGSTPTSSSSMYSSAINLNSTGTTNFKAIAIKAGMLDSTVASKSVTVDQVAIPTFTPNGMLFNSSQAVTMTSTSGSTIYYTKDGSTPTTSSPSITSGQSITLNTTTTLKAMAVKSGMVDSSASSATYTAMATISTPVIAASNITGGQQVTMSCATSGATIHYTTDGSAPTSSSATYSSGINLTSAGTITVKAIAIKSGMVDSSVASKSVTVGQTATPSISPSSGSFDGSHQVTLTCTTSGATIHYTTDGSTPTSSSTSYTTGAFSVSGTVTVKAMAIASGMLDSSVASASYTAMAAVSTPTITATDATGGQQVTMGCATSGATIHYTTDGSAPTSSSATYSSGINLTSAGTTIVKAIAIKSGMVDSAVASKSVVVSQTATPSISPSTGTFDGSHQVTVTCATSGATIHYTTDGSTPTSSSTSYTGAFSVSGTVTVKAMAIASGLVNSSVASASYTAMATVSTPTITATDATGGQLVTMSCATSGATIHYTTDGSNPTSSSATYTGAINLTSVGTSNFKAIAIKSGMVDSAVASKSVTVTQAATIVFNPGTTSFSGSQAVTMTSTSGSTIYYTKDGSTPTTSSSSIASGQSITLSATTTVNAMAVKSGMVDSGVSSATYTVVTSIAAPTFSPVEGSFDDAQTVTISAISGATIYYTSATGDAVPANPTTGSTQFTGAIAVDETTTIKAIAVKSGVSSPVATATFTINGSIIIEF